MRSSRNMRVLAAACVLALSAAGVSAQIVVNGTVDAAYGSPLSTQTINSGFGDSTVGDGTSANGSELDAAYAVVQGTNLYLMLTGNIEVQESNIKNSSSNHIDIFIDDGRGGQNSIPASSGGYLNGMAGSIFSPNFNATLAFDVNDYQNTFYMDTYNFLSNSGSYAGSINLSGGIGSANLNGFGVGFNNTNAAGVNGNTGTAVTNPAVPNAVTTGLELAIPLSDLGNPTGSIKVVADINGSADGYLSDQFLPGLPVGTGNLGDKTEAYSLSTNAGAFNFSSLSNEYFTVAIPAIAGVWTDASGDNNWSDSNNWSNGTVPKNPGDSASFASTSGGNVNVDGSFTVGSISLNSPASSYSLSPVNSSDVLTLNNKGSDATITDYAGTQVIAANLYLASNTDIIINNRGDLMIIDGNISGPGSLSSANPGDGQASLLYLYGTDTYTGGTIINSGTTQLDSSTALPANTALTFNASDVPDPTLDLAGNSISLSSISIITGPQTVPTGAYAIFESTAGAATVTYNGTNANPSSFNGNISAYGNGTISLVVASGSFTLAGFNNMTGATTINSGASLTLANPSGSALPDTSSITNNGSLTIADTETVTNLTDNGALTIATYGDLQYKAGTGHVTLPSTFVLSGGKIDVTDNSLGITYTGTDPISAIVADIKSAYDGGLWDGPGITSSLITTTPGTALGYADSGGSSGVITIKLAWLGDLDLDGSVTAADLQTLTSNLGKTSNVTWAMGDLNYDGVINRDDLSLYMLGDAISGGAPLNVPEPTALAVLTLPLLTLRRRKSIA